MAFDASALRGWVLGGTLLFASVAVAQNGPMIEQVEPTAGPPGTLVHVTGRRFAQNAAVSIGGHVLQTESRLPNRISVRVPEGAPSGHVAVSGSNGTVRGPEFRITAPPPAPVIDSLDPKRGPPGTKLTIRGHNFSPRLAANQVTVGGRSAVLLSATPSALEVSVPDGAASGPITVRVEQAGEAVSGTPFELSAATAIAAVSPERGVPGGQLTIRGSGFSTEPAHNRVFLGTIPLPVTKASEAELIVKLPARIASGKLLVDVQGAGRATAQEPVQVQMPPSVVSFAPQQGAPGTVVKVHGASFGQDKAAIEARIGEATLQVKSVTPTLLELEIPAEAQSGKLSIRVLGVGPAWSQKPFTVVPKPNPTAVRK